METFPSERFIFLVGNGNVSILHHMAVTIRDVAREAGVAIGTVSRVFNNSGPVKASTRKRVEEAARRLGYVPHGAARSLITRRTQTLGVLLPDLYGEFYSELIRGLDQQARQWGYHLLVSGMHADAREMRALVRAMRGRVDGLILMGPHLESALLAEYLPSGVPVVLIGNRADFPCDTVRVDNVAGARMAVAHLIQLGHQRIALLSGPLTNQEARERREFYRQALQEAGLALLPMLELEGDFTEASGYGLGQKLLSRRPTAVFVSNDAMAIGLLRWLHEAGVRVPEQLALVAFDDIPMARYTRPALTTVHSPIYELGARAIDQLLQALSDGAQHVPQEVVLPVHLVVRESCGAGQDRFHPIP